MAGTTDRPNRLLICLLRGLTMIEYLDGGVKSRHYGVRSAHLEGLYHPSSIVAGLSKRRPVT